MRTVSTLAFGLVALTAAVSPAAAQDRSINFALGGGVSAGPEYPGSDDFGVGGRMEVQFGSLAWGNFRAGTDVGAVPENGLGFGGSFRYIGAREAADNPELAGLDDIDAAVELGLAVTWRDTNAQVFAQVRKGFGGHNGVTGQLGADYILRPDDRWTLSAGPRINFGDDNYAATYFGVSAAEAAASSFGAYNAGGGMLGAGFDFEARYQINERWAVGGLISYEKLLGDAGDSPITRGGSEDQWKIGFGLSRAFTLQF